MNFTETQWKQLSELRAFFLTADKTALSKEYWNDSLLSLYDQTFGMRIKWKWDAVLEELKKIGFSPREDSLVLDWGCGTGVAASSFLNNYPNIKSLRLFDRSSIALGYANTRLKSEFPDLQTGSGPADILLISHVITELSESELSTLLKAASEARTVIWIEPGTPTVSHKLIAVRESLRNSFNVVAPCFHRSVCGLYPQKEGGNWCHFYAPVPALVFQSKFWHDFSIRLGIDNRSLPVSYLVLSKDFSVSRTGARVLAGTRFHKGYAEAFLCKTDGVTNAKLLERKYKATIKGLKKSSFCQTIHDE